VKTISVRRAKGIIDFGPDLERCERMLRPFTAHWRDPARMLDSGRVFITPHAKKRRRERRITLPQVLDCLCHGLVSEPAHTSHTYLQGNWQCTMTRRSAGDEVRVCSANGCVQSIDSMCTIRKIRDWIRCALRATDEMRRCLSARFFCLAYTRTGTRNPRTKKSEEASNILVIARLSEYS
jgi:hypothetical protein